MNFLSFVLIILVQKGGLLRADCLAGDTVHVQNELDVFEKADNYVGFYGLFPILSVD
jgi:hypothetical protein